MLPSAGEGTHSQTALVRPAISADLLAAILRELIQPFVVCSLQGHLLLWNRAFEQLSGRQSEQLLKMTLGELIREEDRAAALLAAEKAARSGRPEGLSFQLCVREDELVPVEARAVRLGMGQGYQEAENPAAGDPLLLLAVGKWGAPGNASELQRLEAELRQSQKMEAVGKLAGGIAHDFNNVLTTILGLTDAMIQGRTAPNSEGLREIHQAASHAAELTHHLLAFSRRQILQMRNIGLDDVVKTMAKMISRTIGEDIHLEITCGHPLPPIRADRPQIEQVLLNLCLNARDAMPKGGELLIEVHAETVSESKTRQHRGFRPGSYVLLSVKDNGIGMDEETRARLFEPFFTRKSAGQGTGLGLSMVYGIVKQHDGFIQVSSQPGAGSEFCIYFPASSGETEQPPAERQSTSPATAPSPSFSSRPATILVVEDEHSVRKLILELLPKLGYRAFTAADGEEAIRVFERYADKIDLVLLDAILPKLGGRAVYEAIRLRKPSMRFVFASGYNEEFINSKFELDPSFIFLSKPFNTEDLAAKIREALE